MSQQPKESRPSLFCLVPIAFLSLIVGAGLVGTWIVCFYECLRGRTVEYNYYAAVWTGGLAFFSGIAQLCLICCFHRAMKYFLLIVNFALILCSLICVVLTGYSTSLEYNEAMTQGLPSSDSFSVGVILTGLEAVLAFIVLVFTLVWTGVIFCAGDAASPDESYNNTRSLKESNSRGPYRESFFNAEPSIYTERSQQRERPSEVSYGNRVASNGSSNAGSKYVIPRASLRGASSNGGFDEGTPGSAGRAMYVDGSTEPRAGAGRSRETVPDGFYSGRGYPQMNSQNGKDLASRSGELAKNRYGHNVNLMEMHGVAPTSHINNGYY